MSIVELPSDPETLSEFKNPFDSKYVRVVRFHVYTGNGGYRRSASASVEFVNGDTEGTQKLERPTFIELGRAVDQFVKSLDGKKEEAR